jgi:Zn/Cd-binding protein ZinT
MTKPTQAHISKIIPKNESAFVRDRTLKQTEYYMGAKLLEVGVNPNKGVIYRWKTVDQGNSEEWTYSAYWDDSRAKIEAEES